MADGIPRQELFDVWQNEDNISRRSAHVCDYILTKYGLEDPEGHIREQVHKKSADFCKKLKERWTNSHYVLEEFICKNSECLNVMTTFVEVDSAQRRQIGRPRKLFDECSDRSRKRKLQPLLETHTVGEITLAAEMGLRSTGRRDAAQLINQV